VAAVCPPCLIEFDDDDAFHQVTLAASVINLGIQQLVWQLCDGFSVDQ